MKKNYIKTFESFDSNTTEEESNELIRSVLYKYEDMYNTNPFDSLLFRGTDYHIQSKFKIINPKATRKSISFATENFDAIHNLWMSEHSDWKDYPSRKKECTIASTDYDYASQFGHSTYVIFPLNISTTNIGVCPASDLIHSFSNTIKKTITIGSQNIEPNIESFSLVLYKIFKEYSDKINLDVQEDSYNSLITNLKIINDDILTEYKFRGLIRLIRANTREQNILESIHYYCNDNNKTLIDYFQELLNPIKNNFELIQNISELDNIPKSHNGHEVWFNGPAIFMEIDNHEIPKIETILEKIHRYINS